MECYEGATMIKTFRGKMANDTQDTIVLHTNDGSTGYRIVSLSGMPQNGSTDVEGVLKIYKTQQSTQDTDIDFGDQTLLGAMILIQDDSHENWSEPVVVFDKDIFNQDIYVTWKCHDKTGPANYYIELEQVKLDLGENTVATLKDIRNTKIS